MLAPSAAVETEVTEGTRPVHIPEEEFCERVMKPQPAACQVKHEIVLEKKVVEATADTTHSRGSGDSHCGDSYSLFANHSAGIAVYVLNFGGVRINANKVVFSGDSSLCINEVDGTILSGVSAQAYGTVIYHTGVNTGDTGWSCSGRASAPASRFSIGFSAVQCAGGVPTTNITRVGYNGSAFTPYLITDIPIRLTGTATLLAVTADRWYPEDCVARAQRGR